MATETEEIRGIGHSASPRGGRPLHPRRGQLRRRHPAPRDAAHGDPAEPVRPREAQRDRRLAAQALPGVIAVVTGELMAQHNLAWMPTLSGDTQAVLATDKVRFQGQEVAAVIADDPYVAKDALELIDVDYDPLGAVVTPQRALEDDAPVIRDDKEGQTDNHIYSLGVRRQGGDRTARSPRPTWSSRSTRSTRAPSGAARDVRVRGRRRPRHRPGDDLHDLAGAAPDPHGVRARGGPARGEHPDHLRPTSVAASATRCPSTRATSWPRRPRSCSGIR